MVHPVLSPRPPGDLEAFRFNWSRPRFTSLIVYLVSDLADCMASLDFNLLFKMEQLYALPSPQHHVLSDGIRSTVVMHVCVPSI